ncbi:hypothetical protein VKT23_007812 [Stygiomarasmius scandens]|uniref:Uncharacterized protein n=1 Tax=Marasmiellus scandens TaxID=2682957 RepID=A0ABR1JJ26_9AGAR
MALYLLYLSIANSIQTFLSFPGYTPPRFASTTLALLVNLCKTLACWTSYTCYPNSLYNFESLLHAHSGDSTAQAARYHHTYMDMRNLDISTLGCYPSDSDFEQIARGASEEADSLWALLDAEYEEMFGEEFDHEMEELQELTHINESASSSLSSAQYERLQALTEASIALRIEETNQVNSGSEEIDDETYENFLAEDGRALDEIEGIMNSLPTSFQGQLLPTLIAAVTLDEVSVDALHGARAIQESTTSKQTLRGQIIRAFYDELKSSQARGLTTDQGRTARWYESGPFVSAPGGSVLVKSTGNSANAASAVANAASKVSATRRQLFIKNEVPYAQGYLDTAWVSQIRPLKQNDYGWVWTDRGVFLAKVVVMYAKTTGKNSKHASVKSCNEILALSNIGVQFSPPRALLDGTLRVTTSDDIKRYQAISSREGLTAPDTAMTSK